MTARLDLRIMMVLRKISLLLPGTTISIINLGSTINFIPAVATSLTVRASKSTARKERRILLFAEQTIPTNFEHLVRVSRINAFFRQQSLISPPFSFLSPKNGTESPRMSRTRAILQRGREHFE